MYVDNEKMRRRQKKCQLSVIVIVDGQNFVLC
jgi:hypothetical protein